MTNTAKIAAVTGGAGGIGEACVRILTEKGWRVVVLDRDSLEVREVISLGRRLVVDGELAVREHRLASLHAYLDRATDDARATEIH